MTDLQPSSPASPSDDRISILTYDGQAIAADEDSKGILRDILSGASQSSARAVRHFEVQMDVLEEQMTRLLKQVGTVLGKASQNAGEIAGMELDEVEISVEINGQGEVSLMGIGGQAGATGAMTLKFKRKT